MNLYDLFENKTFHPPSIDVGDDVLVGKFKNKKAKVTGFTKDDNNQPVLKTNKGDQKLFKPRIPKLMEEVSNFQDFIKWFSDYKNTWNIDDAEEITMYRLPKTKLAERLMPVTQTPQFKAWFRKSKAVKNGQPMVFYHGTTKEFRAFDPKYSNTQHDMPAAFFFTDKPDVAQSYAGQKTKDFHFDKDSDEQDSENESS